MSREAWALLCLLMALLWALGIRLPVEDTAIALVACLVVAIVRKHRR